jgi:hypothetical protein
VPPAALKDVLPVMPTTVVLDEQRYAQSGRQLGWAVEIRRGGAGETGAGSQIRHGPKPKPVVYICLVLVAVDCTYSIQVIQNLAELADENPQGVAGRGRLTGAPNSGGFEDCLYDIGNSKYRSLLNWI